MKEKSITFYPPQNFSASKCSVNGRNTNASKDIAATNDARNKVIKLQKIYKSLYFKPRFQRESRWTSSHTKLFSIHTQINSFTSV